MKDKNATPSQLMQVRNCTSDQQTKILMGSAVESQAVSIETDCQFNVWMSRSQRHAFRLAVTGGLDDLQGTRDFDTDQGLGRIYAARGKTLI